MAGSSSAWSHYRLAHDGRLRASNSAVQTTFSQTSIIIDVDRGIKRVRFFRRRNLDPGLGRLRMRNHLRQRNRILARLAGFGFALLTACLAPFPLPAADWPQFLGAG